MLNENLLITIFTFLPGIKAIAVCASISKLWRQAADKAMPRKLVMDDCPGHGSRALAQLFERQLCLVKVVTTHTGWRFNHRDSLFVRICNLASGLQEVTM